MIRYLLLVALVLAGCVTTQTNLEERVDTLEQEVMMLSASGVGAATKMYGRDCVDAVTDSCAKSLDSINTTGWATDDYRAMIINDDKIIGIYYFDYDSTATENYPSVIQPTTGSGRWLLHTGGMTGRIQFAVSDPENLPTHAERNTKSLLVWYNDTGVTFNISSVRAMSDTDDYTFDLFISNTKDDIGTTNDSRVEISSMACSINGTSGYYFLANSGFEDSTIANEQYLIFQHTSGSADALHVYLEGYFY